MSDESDIDNQQSENDIPTQIISQNDVIEPQLDDSTAINPGDEESQFIYDEESNKLICIGINFDDIPQSIIDTLSHKTKILDLSKNRFRSLNSIKNFSYLEELILDDNNLDDAHTRFPKLSNLHTLMINKNRLQDVYKLADQLHHSYPKLAHLSLLGNEACPYRIISTGQTTSSDNTDLSQFAQNRLDEDYQRYRHLLIFRIPTLKFLDAREISANERHVATQLGDILYSIAETKQPLLLTTDDDKKNERKDNYTPLPTDTDRNKNRISVGKVRSIYHGEGSQGNKFVQDGDL